MPGGDAHAGRTETSLLLALFPDAVHLERAEPGNRRPLAELWPALRAGGVAAVSANGVLGDPTGATAAEGRRLFDRLVSDLEAALRDVLSEAETGRSVTSPGPAGHPTLD